MRLIAPIIVLGLLTATGALAQSPNLEIAITEGERLAASVEAAPTEPYQGGPWASIPPTPLNATTEPTAASFRIRTWKEADRARVVVFAVTRDKQRTATDREVETQIATFLLAAGDSLQVSEASKYGARPVTVSARPRQ